MPEFGEKGKENFTHQFGFFVLFSVLAIRKGSKKPMETKKSQGICQIRAKLGRRLGMFRRGGRPKVRVR
jgi:hypothetical protein